MPLLLLTLSIAGSIFALIRWSRPMPVLTEPRCAKCNYDLRGFAGAPPTRCSECGADLTAKGAVRWGMFQRNPRRYAVTIACVCGMPLLFLSLLRFHSSLPVAAQSGIRSNAAVLASLPNTMNQPNDWGGLQSRLTNGKLSKSETKQAIDVLIASFKKQNGAKGLIWADGFVNSADAAGFISSEQFEDLAEAFYEPITVSLPKKVRQGTKVHFTIAGGNYQPLLQVQFVKALGQIKLADGREVAAEGVMFHGRGAPPDPDFLSAGPEDINGWLATDLAPGDYVLNFIVDAAALAQRTAPRMTAGKPGLAIKWPIGRARWATKLVVPLTVVAMGAPAVDLVIDPKLDPMAARAVKVRAVRVTLDATGPRVGVDLTVHDCPIACCFDVSMEINGKDAVIGEIFAPAQVTSEVSVSHVFPGLGPSFRNTDVVLTPNPAKCEGLPRFDRIWGAKVVIPNVAVRRFDLEAGQQSPGIAPR